MACFSSIISSMPMTFTVTFTKEKESRWIVSGE